MKSSSQAPSETLVKPPISGDTYLIFANEKIESFLSLSFSAGCAINHFLNASRGQAIVFAVF
jgi:hypothetical protein